MKKAIPIVSIVAVLALGFALISASCSSCDGKGDKGQGKPVKLVFPPIKEHSLVLETVSPRTEYYRGESGATMTFRLKNAGAAPVTVYEWMAKETDNIRILYAPCEGKPENIRPEAWRVAAPQLVEPVPRMPLDLLPNNSAIIKAKLDFLAGLDNEKGIAAKERYAIVGELNLSSLPLKSKPVLITLK